MKTKTSIRILLLTVVAASACLMSSCKTTKGFGRDLQHLGAKIEQKADETEGY
jgi:predicted small secreted protein